MYIQFVYNNRMFEWDERKRKANLTKHDVDFETASHVFNGTVIEIPDMRHDHGEPRIGVYGEVSGEVLFVIYTWRGRRRRIISARKAGRDEAKLYRVAVGQRKPH